MDYVFGIGGRKAARLFMPADRGSTCKYKFHCCKVRGAWDTISNELVLCAARHTAQRSAVDTIHGGTNSDKPVTAIINAMQSDWNSML
jgi:hypothetical protein